MALSKSLNISKLFNLSNPSISKRINRTSLESTKLFKDIKTSSIKWYLKLRRTQDVFNQHSRFIANVFYDRRLF
jgi:hypothetical protein